MGSRGTRAMPPRPTEPPFAASAPAPSTARRGHRCESSSGACDVRPAPVSSARSIDACVRGPGTSSSRICNALLLVPPLPSPRRSDRRPEYGTPAAIREPSDRPRLRHLVLGRAGERAADELLTQRGYEAVGAGFAARRGGHDLECRHARWLVVGEVSISTTHTF